MNTRRIIFLAVLALLLFLGLYTWNQRTGQGDSLGAHTGLEAAGAMMRAFRSARDAVTGVWDRYLALIDVRERNDELEREVARLRQALSLSREEHAELERLRRLLHLDYPREWPTVGARVLAWRMGPNSALETLMLSRGYLSGATPGTPVISRDGLVGRVLKAGPGTSLALLLTDAGSRVAVISAQGRVQGILAGGGPGAPLELRFVRQNSPVSVGELLVTSGLDSAYPKGVPVARVTSLSNGSTAMEIHAEPLVDFEALEEALLLERPAGWFAPDAAPVYTRRPPRIAADISSGFGAEQDDGLAASAAGRPDDPAPRISAAPAEAGRP